MNQWQEIFHFYCEERNRHFISKDRLQEIPRLAARKNKEEEQRWQRIAWDMQDKKIEITSSKSKVQVERVEQVKNNEEEGVQFLVTYRLMLTWRLKHKKEEIEQIVSEQRKCLLLKQQGWIIVEDTPCSQEGLWIDGNDVQLQAFEEADQQSVTSAQRREYNRQQAVAYAEKWWNDYNPQFRSFDVDCTNYISQCLWAGGAPMTSMSRRDRGWWYRFQRPVNWSFSWSVSHAFRWYLASSKSGLRAEQVASPEQLELGDVICYDFDGDGKWQHTTIVVAKDSSGMPLVNAHTNNSRHRYWAYRDSYAWTEQIKYTFFKIADQL